MAAKVTIDPVSREIQINSGVSEINVRVDLYSDLKEDWLANPSLNRFEFPFRPVAGDSIGLGQTAPMYFFLKYPWVVKTAGDGSFVRLALNLYGQNEDGTDVRNPFLTVPGDSVQNEVSNIPGFDVLTQLAVQQSSFGDHVIVDRDSPYSGTEFPNGTGQKKLNNIPDAVTVAHNRGLAKIVFHSDWELGAESELDTFALVGRAEIETELTILAAAKVYKTRFMGMTLSGVLDGENTAERCVVGDLEFFNGMIIDSSLVGNHRLRGGLDAYYANCKMSDWNHPPSIDLGDAGQNLIMTDYAGLITLKNMDGPNKVGIGLSAGVVTLERATVVRGTVHVSGTGMLKDDAGNVLTTGMWNGNVQIINDMHNSTEIAKKIWSEDLSAYGADTAGNTLVKAEDEIRQAGVVYWDASSSNVGTAYPIGAISKPAKNLSDVLTVCERYGILTIMYKGWGCSLGATDSVDNYCFRLVDMIGGLSSVASTVPAYSFRIYGGYLMGTFSQFFDAHDCDITNISYLSAKFSNCDFRNDIVCTSTLSTHTTQIFDCGTQVATGSRVGISLGPGKLDMYNCSGDWKIEDKTGSAVCKLDFNAGTVEIASTCVAGAFIISGANEVIDNSGAGCTVTVLRDVHDAKLVDDIWTESVSDHSGVQGSFAAAIGKVKFWVNALRRLLGE